MTATDSPLIIPDMSPDVRRPTTSALLLLDFAASKGMTAAAVLKDSPWTLARLSQPGAQISSADELQMIQRVVSTLGNTPALGLELGVRYHLASYGIWGFALMSAPTLLAAFETGLRYLDLTFSYLSMQMQRVGDEVWLTLHADTVPTELRRFLVERDLAAIATIQQELFVTVQPPRRIELALSAPPDSRPYQQLFGQVPHFSAAANRIVFAMSTLDQPLPQADPIAAQIAEAQCRQLLMQRRACTGVAAQVRDALLQDIGGRLPDLETIAARLNMSSRTLRRKLTAEGSSYRALLEELRQLLAEELLVTAGMKVAEVAERLGYSESASFLHARKRWRDRQ
jgi:AraC-like DNA-binding protein